MDGDLPEIFWYVFWIGFVILAFRMAYLGGKSGYEVRMRALDILKMYAEKGTEPPAQLVEQLTDKAFQQQPATPGDPRQGWLTAFISFLFMACVCWGFGAWLEHRGGPDWAVIAAMPATAFFGLGATGFLLAALFARPK